MKIKSNFIGGIIMLKKSILIIISCFLIACSNTDNQTKYVDRKAPIEKEEIVKTVQREEKYYSDTSVWEDIEMQVDRKAPIEKEVVETVQKPKEDSSVLEDVTIQVISDILDLGLKILISTIIPGAFNQKKT